MATIAVPQVAAPARSVRNYDRVFYRSIAVAMAGMAVAGFAPTYYLRLFSGGPTATISGGPFTTFVHLHGALFTAWIVLFIVQTVLISAHRVSVHRRLGIAGAVLAAVMVVVAIATAIAMAQRGGTAPGVPPLSFLAVPVFDMVMFAGFITAALVVRRKKEAHKRLMLLAYISIMAAPAARLPGVLPWGPFAFYGIALVFLVAAIVYDLVARGRAHPAYVWGGALLVASIPLRLALSGTQTWLSFAQFLVR